LQNIVALSVTEAELIAETSDAVHGVCKKVTIVDLFAGETANDIGVGQQRSSGSCEQL